MELVSTKTKLRTKAKAKSLGMSNHSFEIVVIEDNKLTNMILSKTLDSTINTIYKLKKFPIKFSSFQNGGDFLAYLESKEIWNSKLIVFSDYYLEEKMNGGEILKNINQKDIDATVIIMSDTTNKQTSVETINMGAHCFLPKNTKTPSVCSELLSQMVV